MRPTPASPGRPEFALWREESLSGEYDQRRLPLPQKTGAVIGYAMTEKQGGSDLRETQTTAAFVASEDGAPIYSSPATSGSSRCRPPTVSSRWRRPDPA